MLGLQLPSAPPPARPRQQPLNPLTPVTPTPLRRARPALFNGMLPALSQHLPYVLKLVAQKLCLGL